MYRYAIYLCRYVITKALQACKVRTTHLLVEKFFLMVDCKYLICRKVCYTENLKWAAGTCLLSSPVANV